VSRPVDLQIVEIKTSRPMDEPENDDTPEPYPGPPSNVGLLVWLTVCILGWTAGPWAEWGTLATIVFVFVFVGIAALILWGGRLRRQPLVAPVLPAKVGHVVRFVFALLGWVGMSLGVLIVVAAVLTEDVYGSTAAQNAAWDAASRLGLLASTVWVLVTIGLIVRLVGYRVRDALFGLVPIYNCVFLVKILWRWTALPDRSWDRTRGAVEDRVAEADAPRGDQPADPFIAIMCIVVFVCSAAPSPDPVIPTTSYETVALGGLTIVVPPGYYVITDVTDAARIMSESGGTADQRFLDSFVMMAMAGVSQSWIMIYQEPSPAATLFETARDYAWDLEQSGVFVSKRATTVGSGPYPAARIAWRNGPQNESPGPATSFVIDDGDRIWEVMFSMPVGEAAHLAELVDRTMETLKLP
jgi:hypothetical protein